MIRPRHQALGFGLFTACTSLASLAAGEEGFAATGADCSQNGMACRYWVPKEYDANNAYPLLIFLHGAGQRGNDNRAHVEDWGVELLQVVLSAEVQAKHPTIVLAPQCPAEGEAQWVDWPWVDGSYDINQVPESKPLKEVRSMLAALQAKYNVDPNRLYVTGASMGGFGTWDLVSRTPELFAAAVPTDGGASPQAAPRLQNLAIWSFHFADDGSVPVSSDREMFAALAAAGARPYYSEAQLGGHGAQGFAVSSPGFIEWLFEQRRGQPSTAIPELAFAPPGGKRLTPPSVTMTTAAIGEQGEAAALHYTLDGSVPSAQSGATYSAPVQLSNSAILTAVSTSVNDDHGELRVFHAEPYQIGNEPLPGGVMLGDPVATPDGGTNAGGSSSNAGSSSGTTAGSNAASGSTSVNGASSGSSAGGASGVANADPTASGNSRGAGQQSSGCGVSPRPPSNGAAHLLWLIVLGALGRRRPLSR